MPFTPTHVLAVLPLWALRRWLPFAALAIGSMVPDFGLFFPGVDYAQMHAPLGTVTVCLPLGLALFLLFELILRRPLLALLPGWFSDRFSSQPQIPTAPLPGPQVHFYLGVAVAIVLGAFTHQIWDAFTHEGRWGTRLFPALNSPWSIAGYSMAGYKLLQYGSTLMGLPILAAWMMLSRISVPEYESSGSTLSARGKWAAAFVSCVIPVAVGAYALATQASYYRALGMTIRVSGASLLLVCVAYCLVFQAMVGSHGVRRRT